jgi:hypothetical protein
MNYCIYYFTMNMKNEKLETQVVKQVAHRFILSLCVDIKKKVNKLWAQKLRPWLPTLKAEAGFN